MEVVSSIYISWWHDWNFTVTRQQSRLILSSVISLNDTIIQFGASHCVTPSSVITSFRRSSSLIYLVTCKGYEPLIKRLSVCYSLWVHWQWRLSSAIYYHHNNNHQKIPSTIWQRWFSTCTCMQIFIFLHTSVLYSGLNLTWLNVIEYAQTAFLKYLNYSELSINCSFWKSTKYEEAQCCFVLSA